MSKNPRSWLKFLLFQGGAISLDSLRGTPLFILTFLLLAIWKGISVLDGVYTVEFWTAVYGKAPVQSLQISGIVLLGLYLVGALVWWVVTIYLVRLGKVWMHRLGLATAEKQK